jgi:hypothetical protein
MEETFTMDSKKWYSFNHSAGMNKNYIYTQKNNNVSPPLQRRRNASLDQEINERELVR